VSGGVSVSGSAGHGISGPSISGNVYGGGAGHAISGPSISGGASLSIGASATFGGESVLKEGSMKKQGGRRNRNNWSTRHFRLFATCLRYFKDAKVLPFSLCFF
jgi:hypothetical protein